MKHPVIFRRDERYSEKIDCILRREVNTRENESVRAVTRDRISLVPCCIISISHLSKMH